MTDRDEPRDGVPEVTPLDELASALLDGEATAEERSRAGEPDVAARMAQFSDIAAAVGRQPEPPTSAERDAAVAAALAAWERSADEAPRPPADELAERRRRTGRVLRLVGVAAAAVAVVGLGAVLVDSLPSDDAGDAATSAADTTVSSAGSDEQAAEEADAGAGASTPPAGESSRDAASGSDLGRFEQMEALILESAGRVAPTADATVAAPDAQVLAEVASCLPAAFGPDEARSLAPASVLTATLGTRDVIVIAGVTPDGTRVVVFDADTCELLADRTP
jgi:hypothetical protein